MNQDLKAWQQQFDSNFGSKELLRFLGVFAGWLLLGLAVSLAMHDHVIFYPFVLAAFAFPLACLRWKPAYQLLRIILGNENLPMEPRPPRGFGRSRRSIWWSLTSGVGLWIMVLLLIYLIIRELTRLIFHV